jgi:glycosyltransferase involved in cell wall biosynthesis
MPFSIGILSGALPFALKSCYNDKKRKDVCMIDILLATYNGGRYLKEQLDSLLRQTEQDFCVLIQDDGSRDDTPEILKDYAEAHPEKIRLVAGAAHEKSPKGNFMSLLCESTSEYVMFSDQDDVWDEDKIELTIRTMLDGERKHGEACPLLVHTDLRVSDADLRTIAPSFWRYQKLDGDPKLSRVLAQNSITGCTMMVNRTLAELLIKAPAEYMLMHDWWAALCAASMGHILKVDKPTICYRQHGKNQLGATGVDVVRDVKKAAGNEEAMKRRLFDTFRQAESFLNCYKDVLPAGPAKTIRRYMALPQRGKAGRIHDLIRFGHLKKGFFRCLGQLYYC